MTKFKFTTIFMTILILSADWAFADVRDLKLDPRGRGDGFDITTADRKIRCYNDDALESQRPYPPHPMDVKAKQAEKRAKASWKKTDRLRQKHDTALKAYNDSFREELGPPQVIEHSGGPYLDFLKEASEFSDRAYTNAQSSLSGDSVTFEDFYNDPEEAIGDLFVETGENLIDAFTDPPIFESSEGGSLLELVVKEAIMKSLKQFRDKTRNAYNANKVKFGPRPKYWVSDPKLKLASDQATAAYNRQQKISVRASRHALKAEQRAAKAPSNLPACDSDELTKLLDDNFCGDNTPEFFTAAERRNDPVIAKRFDAYLAKVCKAVSGASGGGVTASPPNVTSPPRSAPPTRPAPRPTNTNDSRRNELIDRMDKRENSRPGEDR